jgi:hypothetical protein
MAEGGPTGPPIGGAMRREGWNIKQAPCDGFRLRESPAAAAAIGFPTLPLTCVYRCFAKVNKC